MSNRIRHKVEKMDEFILSSVSSLLDKWFRGEELTDEEEEILEKAEHVIYTDSTELSRLYWAYQAVTRWHFSEELADMIFPESAGKREEIRIRRKQLKKNRKKNMKESRREQ